MTKRRQSLDLSLSATAAYIADLQMPSGALPWFEGGIVDPWDHVEALMGLTIGGYTDQAQQGLAWLANTQTEQGFWHAAYKDCASFDNSRAETNFVSYPATGLWHYYLATADIATLRDYWPMINKAMNWVTNLQTPQGEIYWAVDAEKGISQDALITGCSSIYKSLECTARIAAELGEPSAPWLTCRRTLGETIRHKPDRFDRTWASKSRYSMDWFYPVLTGVFAGEQGRERLAARWTEFVEPQLGCRCVVEEPWVTIAESCELIMACLSVNETAKARQLFDDLGQFQVENGSWWTGYVFTDDVYWPDERPSWTAAALLMAADALYQLTPANHLFRQHLSTQATL